MSQSPSRKKILYNAVIITCLLLGVGVAVILKNRSGGTSPQSPPESDNSTASISSKESIPSIPDSPKATATPALQTKPLPSLVDLGAGKCKACKMMEPVLEELKRGYADQFDVIFIDVWENKAASEQYNVQVIPTQIFFDPLGKELFRHIGYYSEEDILSKWQELGYDIKEKTGK